MPEVIGIGASTGGPGALVEVLRALPQDFRLPVLIVLHIGAPFGAALSSWLESVVHRRVHVAQGGERLATLAGQVLMAPPGSHMVVRSDTIRLNQEPERHSCRPSIDCLFETLAMEHGPRAVGCLLTGMGRDGAAGLLAMRKTGALTIAQDEATSVIYGMPREAAALGAAERVLPLPQIGPLLARLPSRASAREP